MAEVTLRAEVRDCIGPTIPLRRRWVDRLMAGPIARLLARAERAEAALAEAKARGMRAGIERAAEALENGAEDGCPYYAAAAVVRALATAAPAETE